MGDLLEMERNSEIDEELEPERKLRPEDALRNDFIREKQESAIGFKGAVFVKDLVDRPEVLFASFVGRRRWKV